MSDRVSGHPGRSRLPVRAALLLVTLGLIAGPAAPLAAAVAGLTVTTPFPAIVAEPGSTATFEITLESDRDGDVSLEASGAPSGWAASFEGSGLVVAGAYLTQGDPVTVNLNVEIPEDATAGSTTVRVEATGPQGSTTLPVTVRVQEQVGGEVTLESDFPELRGPASSTFTFNLTLDNGLAAETTFAIAAAGPDGWTVDARPAGQSQATSATVAAGSTASITVTADPPEEIQAGTSQILVTVTGGGETVTSELAVTVTGSYSLGVSTPNQVLSTTANAGSRTDLQLTITNSGTAPVSTVTPTASAPTGWTVAFDPETVATIGPNETATVTAQITPSGDAITGDYMVTMSAESAEATDEVEIRVKVETPAFWWIAGLALIAVVFIGLWWVFRTYGRR